MLAIYLAGSIQKGHEKNGTFWTEDNLAELKSLLGDVSFLNPAFRTDDLSDQKSVFGRDMVQVFSSDVVFVDARDRRGLGVGAEMMWAKIHQIPVVTWAPKNSHYNKDATTLLGVRVDNFIHPFIEGLSDKVVHSLADGAEWILQMKSHDIKGIDSIKACMQYYKDNQLALDDPMQKLLDTNERLRKKVLL